MFDLSFSGLTSRPPCADTVDMPITPNPAEVAAIVGRLRAIRAAATPAQVDEGRAWYPAMGRFISEIARESFNHTGDHVSKSLAVGVFAAFSQNATWRANVTMATRYLNGGGLRGLKSVVAEIERMEDGEDPATAIGALKRPDFYRNLMGLHTYVTCDRWHLRAAYGVDKVTLTAQIRANVTAATRTVAAEYGESASACQAVIWCAVRPSGDGK